MAGIELQGTEQLAALGVKLRAAPKTVRREVYRGLNRATKPARQQAKQNAADRLPHGGGLNRVVASSRLTTRARFSANPSVRVVARGKVGIGRIDRGTVRHPVFGNRAAWVTQQVPPGWFSDAMQSSAPEARGEIEQAVRLAFAQLGAL